MKSVSAIWGDCICNDNLDLFALVVGLPLVYCLVGEKTEYCHTKSILSVLLNAVINLLRSIPFLIWMTEA